MEDDSLVRTAPIWLSCILPTIQAFPRVGNMYIKKSTDVGTRLFFISFSLIWNNTNILHSYYINLGFSQAVLRKSEKEEIAKFQKSSSKHVLPVLRF